ncbi:hypothetical protein V1512DRAFT_50746 [Lipomyces arxii]|uniref:uncharacterized protein n=1 Tax=Lipomyces arxii TaxID=56418 RepID=UPI0034D01987
MGFRYFFYRCFCFNRQNKKTNQPRYVDPEFPRPLPFKSASFKQTNTHEIKCIEIDDLKLLLVKSEQSHNAAYYYERELTGWQRRLQALAEEGWPLDGDRVDRIIQELAKSQGDKADWFNSKYKPATATGGDLDMTATVEDLKAVMAEFVGEGDEFLHDNAEPAKVGTVHERCFNETSFMDMQEHPDKSFCHYCSDLRNKILRVAEWTLVAEKLICDKETSCVDRRQLTKLAVVEGANFVRHKMAAEKQRYEQEAVSFGYRGRLYRDQCVEKLLYDREKKKNRNRNWFRTYTARSKSCHAQNPIHVTVNQVPVAAL